jgi:ceramide glucosyltransferase
MSSLAIALLAVTTTWTVLGLVGLVRTTRRSPRRPDSSSVSVLKPLSGADEDLEANLESFFVQDHPSYELVFGVQDPHDPAVPIVRRLIAAHPEIKAKLVLHSGTRANNPKIANLGGMLPHARGELILISDSNIRAPSGYLSDLVRTMGPVEDRVGLVSNLFAGTGEETLGAAIESVQINGFIASGVVTPAMLGSPVVVGKSMLMRRSVFARIGGLSSVADVLAEDYVIGKMFQHAGWRVVLAPTVLENVNRRATVSTFWKRHLRWSMLRIRLEPVAFALEPLASPLAMLPIALATFGPWAVAWALGIIVLRDVAGWIRLRGLERVWLPVVLAPVREVLILAIWASTPFRKHVSWRGHRVRLGAGTRAYAPDPASEESLEAAR